MLRGCQKHLKLLKLCLGYSPYEPSGVRQKLVACADTTHEKCTLDTTLIFGIPDVPSPHRNPGRLVQGHLYRRSAFVRRYMRLPQKLLAIRVCRLGRFPLTINETFRAKRNFGCSAAPPKKCNLKIKFLCSFYDVSLPSNK